MSAESLSDDQLQNLVTVYWMRRHMGCVTIDGRWDHCLILPAGLDTPVLTDYTELRVYLPLNAEDLPQGVVGKMLKPLAELCAANAGVIPLSKWTYEWFYLELLDREKRVSPLCWISVDLLERIGVVPAHEASRQKIAEGPGAIGELPGSAKQPRRERKARSSNSGASRERESRLLRAHQQAAEWLYEARRTFPFYGTKLLAIDQTKEPVQIGTWPASEAIAEESIRWRELFRQVWRENEERWVRQGLVRFDSVKPWLQMLVLDRRALPVEGQTSIATAGQHGSSIGSISLPWLRWKMIPLYDARDIHKVREAMKQELFVTSVFNWHAKPRQNARLWSTLEQRFALKFQRSSYLAYRSKLRRRKVLEWTLQGKSINETARLLLENDLHPLDEYEIKYARAVGADVFEVYFDAARRTVIRLRAEFHNQGKIPEGDSGRRLPIKQHKQQAQTE